MIRKQECTLVEITEGHNEKKSPIKIENKLTVACDDMGTWSSRYYVDRNRDMMTSVNLRVTRDYDTIDLMKVRYVDYKGIRYEVNNFLNDKSKGNMYVILDLQEYKR